MNEILKRLYEHHAPALILYARIWCRFPDDAVQEAMIELARQSEMPPDPVAWLYQAVRFRAINLHRGDQRRTNREHDAACQREPFFVAAASDDFDTDEVEDALRHLSVADREIVVAKIWGGLTFDKIAELTRQSSSTVHRRYHTSLETMKQKLSGITCEDSGHE